jgi:hypothetical protein
VPELPSRVRARYAALLASGLRPVAALAVTIAVMVGRAVPVLAVVAVCGATVDGLGARAVGAGIAGAVLVVLSLSFLALAGVCAVSDVAQLWLRWVLGEDFTVLYSRGWSFWRTVWAGIRGTNRLYQRRYGYRQLDL